MVRSETPPPRPGALPLSIGSTRVWLLAERAVWWPAAATLVVSDLHLGRPPGDSSRADDALAAAAEDLARVGDLVDRLDARRLWILGDLRHAVATHLALADDVLATWLLNRGGLDVLLIRGNQDRDAGDPLDAPGLEIDDGGRLEGPFTLHHEPPERGDPSACSEAWLAGHLHPAATSGGPRGIVRPPAFLREGRGLVLPAFGSGTRAHPVRPRPQQSLFAIRDGSVEAPIVLERP